MIYILSFILVALQGCQLESEMYGDINPTLFPTTVTDAEALVTGSCYNIFRANWGNVFCTTDRGIQVAFEKTSDIGEYRSRDKDIIYYVRWTDPTYWAVSDLTQKWDWVKFIGSMTLNIDRIEQMDINETDKNRLIAELRCGRGFLAFLMYDCFGPVPLADLETLKNPLEEKILPRATEEEMQTFIETELTEAAKVLPYVYKKGDPDYGRFSKGICYTILMKYYMHTKQWAKAEAAGRELLKSDYGYDLVPRYKDIFTLANEKNAETIFSFNSLDGYQEHEWISILLPSDYPTDPDYVTKWNSYRLAWWFVHTYEEGDQRLETIVTEYVGTGGQVHNEELDGSNNGDLKYGAIPMKYEIDKTTSGSDNQTDFIIYRFADVLTLLSEAIVRGGNSVTQESIDLLNRVRTRAGLPAYTAADFSSPRDFLDKLLMERAHEHYWEGFRRQDLIRDGSYIEAIQKKAQRMGQTTLVNENYYRFPLPQSVIDEGKGLILQNPGY